LVYESSINQPSNKKRVIFGNDDSQRFSNTQSTSGVSYSATSNHQGKNVGVKSTSPIANFVDEENRESRLREKNVPDTGESIHVTTSKPKDVTNNIFYQMNLDKSKETNKMKTKFGSKAVIESQALIPLLQTVHKSATDSVLSGYRNRADDSSQGAYFKPH
jgi:hypothetical protein